MTVPKRNNSTESLLLFQRLPWIMPSIYSCPKFHHVSYGEKSHTARAFHFMLNLDLLGSSQCLLTIFQVMMLLYQFDHQTLAATSWPLKLICVMFSNFWTVSDLTAVPLLLQKSLNKELIVKIFVVPYMLPTVNNITCYWALKRLLHCGFDLHFPDG